MAEPLTPEEALTTLDDIIAHVATWPPAGDGFLDNLRAVRATLDAERAASQGDEGPPSPDLATLRANWPEHFSAEKAKGWIAACDRIEGLITAASSEPAAPRGDERLREAARRVVAEARAVDIPGTLLIAIVELDEASR